MSAPPMILFRQVEGHTEWGVGGKLMESTYGGNEGVQASDPVEEDAGEPWVLMGKQMVLLTVFSGTLHVSAGGCPKLLSQTQKFTIKMG